MNVGVGDVRSGVGALVATRFAGCHPERLAKLILSRPVVRFDAARCVEVFARTHGSEAGSGSGRGRRAAALRRLVLPASHPLVAEDPRAIEVTLAFVRGTG